jgi:hypothetical protein
MLTAKNNFAALKEQVPNRYPTPLLLHTACLTIILKLLPKFQTFIFIFDKLWLSQTDKQTPYLITPNKNEFNQEDVL